MNRIETKGRCGGNKRLEEVRSLEDGTRSVTFHDSLRFYKASLVRKTNSR